MSLRTYIVTAEVEGIGHGTVKVQASSLDSVYNNLKKEMKFLRRIVHVERDNMVNEVTFNLQKYE